MNQAEAKMFVELTICELPVPLDLRACPLLVLSSPLSLFSHPSAVLSPAITSGGTCYILRLKKVTQLEASPAPGYSVSALVAIIGVTCLLA